MNLFLVMDWALECFFTSLKPNHDFTELLAHSNILCKVKHLVVFNSCIIFCLLVELDIRDDNNSVAKHGQVRTRAWPLLSSPHVRQSVHAQCVFQGRPAWNNSPFQK